MIISEWWSRIENWNMILVYDGPDYLMMYWLC
jgi:hypothetical protein